MRGLRALTLPWAGGGKAGREEPWNGNPLDLKAESRHNLLEVGVSVDVRLICGPSSAVTCPAASALLSRLSCEFCPRHFKSTVTLSSSPVNANGALYGRSRGL